MNSKHKAVTREFAIVDNHKDTSLVGVEVTRNGDFTIATAACTMHVGHNGNVVQYRSTGASVKNDDDKEDVSIGERLAVGRALHKLGTIMISDTMYDVQERCRSRKEHPFQKLSLLDLEAARMYINRELRDRRNTMALKEKKRNTFLKEMQNG